MSQIILPASVKYNLERERMASRHESLKWFDTELKALDEHSELIKASESAEAPGMIPGFWHVRRTDPVTGWQAYLPLTGPEGKFSEPHSGHLEKMRASDLQRPGAFEDLKRRWDAEDEAHRREQLWTREEFKREFAERYLNKIRPSVSFSDVGHWTNRAGARRG